MVTKIDGGAACQPRTKAELVERLLAGKGGATLAELMEPTGWQAHTCRAFLTGLRKKGRTLTRDKREDGTTFYRLIDDGAAFTGGGGPASDLCAPSHEDDA